MVVIGDGNLILVAHFRSSIIWLEDIFVFIMVIVPGHLSNLGGVYYEILQSLLYVQFREV